MVQQTAFSAILQSLNRHKSLGSETKTKLEDKSKHSRSRVHYGKFVRAKDVSQYSQESLNIVLGKSADEFSGAPETDGNSSASDDNRSPSSEVKQEFGVKTYSSTTDLTSYFLAKRKALKSEMSENPSKRKCKFATDSINECEVPMNPCASSDCCYHMHTGKLDLF